MEEVVVWDHRKETSVHARFGGGVVVGARVRQRWGRGRAVVERHLFWVYLATGRVGRKGLSVYLLHVWWLATHAAARRRRLGGDVASWRWHPQDSRTHQTDDVVVVGTPSGASDAAGWRGVECKLAQVGDGLPASTRLETGAVLNFSAALVAAHPQVHDIICVTGGQNEHRQFRMPHIEQKWSKKLCMRKWLVESSASTDNASRRIYTNRH